MLSNSKRVTAYHGGSCWLRYCRIEGLPVKTRPDGTILGAHHRTTFFRQRGIDVDILPRDRRREGNH